MRYKVKVDGFEGKKVEVEIRIMKIPRLFIDGELIPKGKKNKMILERNDGTEVIAMWKNKLLDVDTMPKLVVDNKEIQIAEPLKWYVKAWCSLPLLLFLWGGAIGGVCGFGAISVNSGIFRSSMNILLKLLLSIVTCFLALAAYEVIAYFIS